MKKQDLALCIVMNPTSIAARDAGYGGTSSSSGATAGMNSYSATCINTIAIAGGAPII
ncbi:MAG TPA: hypothetical protein VN086_01540 [Candidatus Paceibacterota bacterium]|nr:hypothetical protein [Candidatus Paceibacterota bacterium]